jgi:hypothetical protein
MRMPLCPAASTRSIESCPASDIITIVRRRIPAWHWIHTQHMCTADMPLPLLLGSKQKSSRAQPGPRCKTPCVGPHLQAMQPCRHSNGRVARSDSLGTCSPSAMRMVVAFHDGLESTSHYVSASPYMHDLYLYTLLWLCQYCNCTTDAHFPGLCQYCNCMAYPHCPWMCQRSAGFSLPEPPLSTNLKRCPIAPCR